MPTFSLIFVLLIFFSITNNFLKFQFDSVKANSIKINEIKADFKDVINSTIDNEMKIKIANDLKQKLSNQKYENSNLINENLKMVEKIKDHEIYSEVKKLLTDNNYDEAISKLKDKHKWKSMTRIKTNLKKETLSTLKINLWWLKIKMIRHLAHP